jgi:plastocyanin
MANTGTVVQRLFGTLIAVTTFGWALDATAQTGRIEGVASISRQLTTSRPRVRLYDEPGSGAAKPAPDEHPFTNVVLYVESVASADSRLTAMPAMRQQGERFLPHVLPVLAGSTVQFPNGDPIYHNVFSLSRARTFDLGRYAQGSSKDRVFPEAGVVQVFCHIHADMSGYILVLANSFFTTPDEKGRFSLEGVPPGEYRLIAWHERIRPNATVIRVAAGQTTRMTVSIPITDNPTKPAGRLIGKQE